MLVPDRQERARRSSYRLRFGLIYVLLAAVVGAGVGSFIVLASGDDKPDGAGLVGLAAEGQHDREGAPDRRPDPEGVPGGERRAAHGQPRQPALGADAAGRRAGARGLRPPRHVEGARGGGRHRRLPRRRRRLVRALRDAVEGAVRARRRRLGRAADAAAPAGARALALHAQVRRRHRLGGRLHAAREGEEPKHGLPAPERRRRRARPAAQLAAPDGEAEGRRPELARGGADPAPDPDADVRGGGAGVAGRQPGPDPDAAGRKTS